MATRSRCDAVHGTIACIVVAAVCFSSSVQASIPHACAEGFDSFPFCNTALPVEDRVLDFISRLTLDEKLNQLVDGAANISRLGIPAYEWWYEALHGLSRVTFVKEVPGVTTFPQVILTTASFNRTLWNLIAQAVSTEARAMYNVGLSGLTFWSPNVNIFRDPRWGRGQETPGEDPLVVSEYAIAYVTGLQGREYNEDSHGVGMKNRRRIAAGSAGSQILKVSACCKHFTAYDLEAWGGTTRYTFDALVTQQDLIDTYQPPFRSCIEEAQATCIMCSYNRVNGIPSCADRHLLTQVARQEWGLQGYITSDCDAVAVVYEYIGYASSPEDAVADCLNSGMDLNCGTYVSNYGLAAIQKGALNVSEVDRALFNLFTVRMQLGLFDGDPKAQPFGDIGPDAVCNEKHRQLALEAARQGLVLLKNEDEALPLSKEHIDTLAVIGPNANASTDALLGNYAGIPCITITPLEGLQKYANVLYQPGCLDVSCISDTLLQAAVESASIADAVILIVGLDQSQEREDHDRIELVLPGQQQNLISKVTSSARGPVVLVIMSGGPVDVSFARDNSQIQSILWAGYPGEAGGQAIAEVIFGDFNPGGRLPITWYSESFVQVPMTDMNMRANTSRGYPGRTYRFYKGDPVFQFGHGLSYTRFSSLFVSAPCKILLPFCMNQLYGKDILANTTPSTCCTLNLVENNVFNEDLTFNITIRVSNHGNMRGSHSVLLFSKSPSEYAGTPEKQLLGFKQVHLEPEASVNIHFTLNPYEHMSFVNEYGRKVLSLGPHLLTVSSAQHTILLQVSGTEV